MVTSQLVGVKPIGKEFRAMLIVPSKDSVLKSTTSRSTVGQKRHLNPPFLTRRLPDLETKAELEMLLVDTFILSTHGCDFSWV